MKRTIDNIFKLSKTIHNLYVEHVSYLTNQLLEANEKGIFLDESNLLQDEQYQKWLQNIQQCIDLEDYCYIELTKKMKKNPYKFKELVKMIKRNITSPDKIRDIHFFIENICEENQEDSFLWRRFYNQLYRIAVSTNNAEIISSFYFSNLNGYTLDKVELSNGKTLLLGENALPFDAIMNAESNILLSYNYMISAAIKEGVYPEVLLGMKYNLFFINKGIENVVAKNNFIMNDITFDYPFETITAKGNQLLYKHIIRNASLYDTYEFIKLLYSFTDEELSESSEIELEQSSIAINTYILLLRSALMKLSLQDIREIEINIENIAWVEECLNIDEHVKQVFTVVKNDLILSKLKR